MMVVSSATNGSSSTSSSSHSVVDLGMVDMGMVADAKLGQTWHGVFFRRAPSKVFSAERVQTMVACLVAEPIETGLAAVEWRTISWDGTDAECARVCLYARSAATTAGIPAAAWHGPFLRGSGDASALGGGVLQIMVVIVAGKCSGAVSTPVVDRVSASCMLPTEAEEFYTRAFELGFRPTHILLTCNAPSGSVLRFAVSGVDTADPAEYQEISANSLEELDGISILSRAVKVMVRGFGSRTVPFVVDEVAFSVSGDGQRNIDT